MLYADQTLNGASHCLTMTSSASVFPRYSTRIFKEALAVISLALLVVASAMFGTVFVSEWFGGSPAVTACTMLDQTILLTSRSSALI